MLRENWVLGCLFLLMWIVFAKGHRYVVTTYTGDRFGAGTDAHVFLKLFGTRGESDDKELESSGRDNFERGQIDTFIVETKDAVGSIKKARIHHDNSWLGPGWFLEKVTVTDDNGDYYVFPVHKWFDKHQDDKQLSRDITPNAIQKKDEIESKRDQPEPRQPLDCSWPQGIGNNKLSNDQISASTSFNDLHLPYHSRLGQIAPNSLGGWCPYKNNKDEYLQFDLGKVKRIAGVATQGMGLVDEWTTSYRLLYSNQSDDGFKEYSDSGTFPKYFLGNDDQNGTVLHWLRHPLFGQYVRISPFKWHGKGCLRAELYGCPTAELKTSDTNYIQLPQRNQNMDENSNDKTAPPENTRSEEHDTLVPSKNPGAVAGDKHEDIPIKRTPDLNVNKPPQKDNTPITMLQSEANYDPVSSIDVIPIVHLDFDEIKEHTIPDISGHHNDAHFRPPIDIRMFSKSCERGVRMNGGDIYFDGEFFVDKPRSEVTIAAWIKLFSNGGQHSVFNTIGGKNSVNKDGHYHLEVDRGRLRWYHRNEANQALFNVSSPLMIPAHAWTHCAATYSSVSGKATVYINAKLAATGFGTGILSQDWTGRAGIGQHRGERVLNGELDEFYMFSKALPIKKIQMLMKRCSFEIDCQRSIGMQSKEIKDDQVTASTTYNLHKPYYGRINLASFGGDPARTAWCAVKDDRSPFFEIALSEMTSLTGVATQGLSLFDNWVTSYLFCYSDNKDFWNCYKEKGYDKVFEANTDKNSIKRHHFHHTVDAKFVRIRPQSWYGNHLCMRVELYGCTMDLLPDSFDSFGNPQIFMEDTEAQTRNEIAPKESCNKPLGVSNGEVDDMHVTSSSALDESHLPFYGRLVRESIDQSELRGCWCAKDVNLRQYIEADLGEVKTITGIATQGFVSHDNWVVSYRLGFSDETTALEWYREEDDERLFEANKDRSTIVKHFLTRPVKARYVRLNPRAWHGIHICMRFEVFGCKETGTSKPKTIVLEDEATEFTDKVETREHHVPTLRLSKVTEKATEDVMEKFKQKLAEENADNKQHIPQKVMSLKSPIEEMEEKLLKSQVRSHTHAKNHEVKRIKPGHGTAREMLQITYPAPVLPIEPTEKKEHKKPVHSPIKSLKIGPNKKPIAATQANKDHDGLNSEAKEEAMLKVVDKLQNLSDDKLAAEMKGPILALAKEKIIEDLMNFKGPKKHAKSEHHKAPCTRDGKCKENGNRVPNILQSLANIKPETKEDSIVTQDQMSNFFPHLAQPQKEVTPTELLSQPQSAFLPAAETIHPPSLEQQQFYGDNDKLKNQVAVAITQSMQQQQNKQQQINDIQKSFPYPNYNVNPSNSYPVTRPSIDAVAVLQKYPDLRKNGITEETLKRLANRVPNLEQRIRKHYENRDRVRAVYELNRERSEKNNRLYSSPEFLRHFQKYLEGSSLSSHENPATSTAVTSTFNKPPGIDERPCRRDGSCFFPEALFNKQPHAMSPKPDVWIKDAFHMPVGYKDDTRQTPDHLMPPGPDPRIVEYYKSYLEGHPGEIHPTAPPPPPQPPPASPVTSPMHIFDLQTTVENVPPGSTIESSTYLTQEAPTFPHGGLYQWTPFSICSVTCGQGEKKRFRRCVQQDCPSGGVEIETAVCAGPNCPETDQYTWSPFTTCSASCGVGLSSRYRLCQQTNCAGEGYETEQIACYQPNCPVCILDFEVIQNHVVIDQSGMANHGYLDQQVVIREHPQICGHFADLTNVGEVLFSAQTFLGKPRNGISIACWVNIQGDMAGKHSIFSTIRKTENGFIGGYHLEIYSGAIRWFHRDEQSRTIYSMMTSQVVVPHVWMHFTAIYDGYRGIAKVYVDGKEQGSVVGNGMLSLDWGYKASIGYYDFDDRRITGWVDEFIMYDYALNDDQVFSLLGKMRCPTGNTTTIEIDAFRFENMMSLNLKRSIKEEDEINGTVKDRSSKDNLTSKINTKRKRKRSEISLKDKRDISNSTKLSIHQELKRNNTRNYIREITELHNIKSLGDKRTVKYHHQHHSKKRKVKRNRIKEKRKSPHR